jgi:cystathionine beta-synthase
VRITRSDVGKGHPDYYQDMAARIAQETGAFYVNQFANPANPEAHEKTTGPEIWEQMDHDVDAVVVGVGSGGTLTGIGRFFKRVSPKTEMVLADPVGSILAPLVRTGKMIEPGSWTIEGIGEDFIPPNCDLSLVSRAYTIPTRKAWRPRVRCCRRKASSQARRPARCWPRRLRYCREQTTPKRVVTLVPDSGNKYLSKIYNDYWVIEQGLADRKLQGDLSDLIARRFDAGGTVTVAPDDSLLVAYSRMRAADVSQLPVVENDRIVGILDESDILAFVEGGDAERARASANCRETAMTTKLRTVQVDRQAERAAADCSSATKSPSCSTARNSSGLITRVDLINHLRLNP